MPDPSRDTMPGNREVPGSGPGSGSGSGARSDSRNRPMPVRPLDEPDGGDDPFVSGYDKFDVGRVIGEGGMGTIRAVFDQSLRRDSAIKVLQKPDEAAAMHRFITEARITGQLQHPNIVPIHELGVDDRGRPWMAMKLVRGETLGEWVRSDRRRGPLTHATIREILDIVSKVCDALAYAHSAKVIHRDLKPDNVMVGEHGEVMVMDWGLARAIGTRHADSDREQPDGDDHPDDSADQAGSAAFEVEDHPAGSDITVDGSIIGTPAYMAPEQASGATRTVDHRTDIFAIGALLYELLTLHPPYDGDGTWEVLRKARARDLEPPRQVAPDRRIPRELEEVVLKAMARKPADRYPSVEAMQADINAWRDGRTMQAATYTSWQLFRLWARRNKGVVSTAAIALVAVLALGVVFIVQLDAARRDALAARDRADDQADQAGVARESADRERLRAVESMNEAHRQARAADAARTESDRQRRRAEDAYDIALAYRARLAIDNGDRLSAIRLLGGATGPRSRALAFAVPPPIHSFVRTLIICDVAINAAVWAPNTLDVTLGGEDGSLFVIDDAINPGATTGIGTTTQPIRDVAIDRHAGRIAAVGRDGSIGIGKPGAPPTVSLPAVGADGPGVVCFHPHGRLLAAGWRSGIVTLIESHDGRTIHQLAGHRGTVTAIAFPLDAMHMVTTDLPGEIRIWSMADLQAPARVISSATAVRAAAFDLDSKRFAVTGDDSSVRIFDVATGRETMRVPISAPGTAIAFEDHHRLVVGTATGVIHVIDLEQRAAVEQWIAHTDRVRDLSVSHDGRWLVSASADGAARVWEIHPRPTLLVPSGVAAAQFTADAQSLIVAFEDGRIDRVGTWPPERRVLRASGSPVVAMALHPDGQSVLVATATPAILRLDLTDGREIGRWASAPVTAIACHHHPPRVALALNDHTIRIYGDDLSIELAWFHGHEGLIRDIEFSPDGQLLASGGDDDTTRLWNATDGAPIAQVNLHDDLVTALAFHPGGGTLVTCGIDDRWRLLDVATHREIRAGPELDGTPVDAAWLPDGTLMVIASPSGLQVIQPGSGDVVLTITDANAARLRSISVSPDGLRIAGVFADGSLRVWGGTVPMSPQRARRRSGLELAGFDVVPTRIVGEQSDPIGPLDSPDLAAADFWQLRWRPHPHDRETALASWRTQYPDHPLTNER